MADAQSLLALSDDALGDALRELGAVLDVPMIRASDGMDPARRARLRIESAGPSPRAGILARLGLTGPSSRPLRRGLVLALVALLAVAAVVGAVGFGLPGLRIVFGPTPSPTVSVAASSNVSPTPSPSRAPTPTPTVGPPGSTLALGRPVTIDDARAEVAFPILLPTGPRLGPPDAVWIDDVRRVTLVWTARPGLPATIEPDVALVVTEFPGTINPDYFEKILRTGTTIEPVTVGGHDGYWISGSPHDFVYVNPAGEPTYDDRRLVGDTLAWSVDGVTYRIETGEGREAAIAMAESMR